MVPDSGAFTATSIYIKPEYWFECLVSFNRSNFFVLLHVLANLYQINPLQALGIPFINCFTVPSESDSAKGGTGIVTFATTSETGYPDLP
jgi:hypothetical protein